MSQWNITHIQCFNPINLFYFEVISWDNKPNYEYSLVAQNVPFGPQYLYLSLKFHLALQLPLLSPWLFILELGASFFGIRVLPSDVYALYTSYLPSLSCPIFPPFLLAVHPP